MHIFQLIQYHIFSNYFQNRCAIFVNNKQTCIRKLQTLFHFCKMYIANIAFNLCTTKLNLNIDILKTIIINIVYTNAKIEFVRNYTQRQRWIQRNDACLTTNWKHIFVKLKNATRPPMHSANNNAAYMLHIYIKLYNI